MFLQRQSAPNLFLVGFMGTGKSALGRLLANRWRRPFLDTDHLIEQRIKMSIREYFEKHAEPAFRALERECIEQWIPDGGAVISCGGGLVIPDGMIELLRHRGVVVCLFASPETILRRTRHSNHRPLLKSDNPEERIRELLEKREPIYMRSGTGVLTDGRNLLDLASAVERIYRREARHYSKQKTEESDT